MKKHARKFISFFLVVLAIVFFVVYTQNNFYILYNDNSWRIRNFYREDYRSIDVVLIGVSDVYTGFYPGIAYEKYGFTSYPLCVDGKTDTVLKPEIKEAIREQNPKMIVVDIGGALYEDEVRLFDDGIFREFFDNTPLTFDKIRTMFDMDLKEDYISYCFPMVKYRGNIENAMGSYNQITYFNSIGISKLKGIGTTTVIDRNQSSYEPIAEKKEMNRNSQKIFMSFLDYCKNEKIDNIVFVRFPEKYVSADSLDVIRRCNTAKEIIADYGYDVIDCTDIFDQIGLDRDKDFYNEEHMNVYGAVKFTEYLSGILVDKYGVGPSVLNDGQKKQWEETVKYTNAFIDISKRMIEKGEEVLLGENKETYEMIENELNDAVAK